MTILAEIPSNIQDKINQLPNPGSTDAAQENIINYLLYGVGLMAVIMLIVGAIQLTTSAGDSGAVAKAKKTILYAVIGLVVALLAYAIVNFVIRKVA